MRVAYYLDVHVPRAVRGALQVRNIDVLTAQQDNFAEADDYALLMRATSLHRVLVSQDEDLLREGARYQAESVPFAEIVYAHQMAVGIGKFVEDLVLIAEASSLEDWKNRICYLPL